MSDKPFAAIMNQQGKFTVKGPCTGLGYYNGTLFPENAMENLEVAERTARMMNMAFEAGRTLHAKKVRNLLGID